MTPNKTHFIEMESPCTAQEVEKALRNAGLNPSRTREVSNLIDGVIVTENLLEGL